MRDLIIYVLVCVIIGLILTRPVQESPTIKVPVEAFHQELSIDHSGGGNGYFIPGNLTVYSNGWNGITASDSANSSNVITGITVYHNRKWQEGLEGRTAEKGTK